MANPESKIVRQVIESIKSNYPGAYVRKINGNLFQHPGIPDIICCINGKFIGLEIKTGNGKTSLIQQLEGSVILAAGGIYGVATSPKQALDIIALGFKSNEILLFNSK